MCGLRVHNRKIESTNETRRNLMFVKGPFWRQVKSAPRRGERHSKAATVTFLASVQPLKNIPRPSIQPYMSASVITGEFQNKEKLVLYLQFLTHYSPWRYFTHQIYSSMRLLRLVSICLRIYPHGQLAKQLSREKNSTRSPLIMLKLNLFQHVPHVSGQCSLKARHLIPFNSPDPTHSQSLILPNPTGKSPSTSEQRSPQFV